MGLVAPRHVGSSQTRARTRVPCIGRWILNHCATREALVVWLFSPSPSRETGFSDSHYNYLFFPVLQGLHHWAGTLRVSWGWPQILWHSSIEKCDLCYVLSSWIWVDLWLHSPPIEKHCRTLSLRFLNLGLKRPCGCFLFVCLVLVFCLFVFYQNTCFLEPLLLEAQVTWKGPV